MVFNLFGRNKKVDNELQYLSKRIGAVENDDSLNEIKSIIKTEFKIIEDTHKEAIINAKEITKTKADLKAEKDKTKNLSFENKELKKLLEKVLENNEQLIKKVQNPKKEEVKVVKEVAKVSVVKPISKAKTSQDIAKKVNSSVKTINDAAKKIKTKISAKKTISKKVSSSKKTSNKSEISKISQESAKPVEA